MLPLVMAGALVAHDLMDVSMKVVTEQSTSLLVQPRVMQELVGVKGVGPDEQFVVSVEDKSPSVGRVHFQTLLNLAKEGGDTGWEVPRLADCTEIKGTAHLQGPTSIIGKVSYFLTDPEQPHSYAVLSDGTCLYLLVKRSPLFPSFFISPPILFTDPNLFRILAYPFLGDPPFTLDSSSPPTGSDGLESPLPPTNPAPPVPVSDSSSPSPLTPITIHFSLTDRPNKTATLHPVHPTLEPFDPIILSSFDTAPSRATILRGHAGAQPIVLKMAEEGRDDETEEEGNVYRERLRGLDGVPKLYAEGRMLADNGQLAYCLVLEDLGLPLTSEGLETLDELDPQSRAQLATIEARLLDRGVIHDDLEPRPLNLEPRNVLRTPTGGIALIDFEGAELVLVKQKDHGRPGSADRDHPTR
ncbi:hypothetical protein DFH09DRAFT_1163924 [Mycena vulgaris]|nr:hypothetical protein DFH09DRAFT_1163924 [Mycena vulgaris]